MTYLPDPAPVPDAIEVRLQRIETAIENLTAALTRVCGLDLDTAIATPRVSPAGSGPHASTGQSYMSASLAQASEDLEQLRTQSGPLPEHENASEGLRDLSSVFGALQFDDATNVRNTQENFFIPDRQAGYALMSR